MKHIIKQFTQRDAHPIVQFIKYGMAGGVATFVDISVFYFVSIWVLPGLGQDDIVVKLFSINMPEITEAMRGHRFIINSIIAFFFSNLTCYLINIFWVFEPGRHKWYVEMGLFYAVSGTSIGLGILVGSIGIEFFGMSTTFSYIAKGVSSLMINYLGRKFFIFKG